MNKIFSFIFIAAALGCQSSSKHEADPATFDPAQHNLRHGFTVFTGPERTILGVNDTDSIEKGRKLLTGIAPVAMGRVARRWRVGQELNLKPANLAAIARNFPNHYLVIQINQGRGDMPVWQDLSLPEQVWNLSRLHSNLGRKK